MLTIKLSSSYVLIETASFLQGSETEVFTPYRLPGQIYYIVMVQRNVQNWPDVRRSQFWTGRHNTHSHLVVSYIKSRFPTLEEYFDIKVRGCPESGRPYFSGDQRNFALSPASGYWFYFRYFLPDMGQKVFRSEC